MPFEEARQHCLSVIGGRDEEPDLPGDHFGEQAEGSQPVAHAVGEAGELDAIVVHHPHPPQRHVAGKGNDRRASEQRLPHLCGSDDLRLVEPEIPANPREPFRRDQTADDTLALVGLKTIDPAIILRQQFPDGQQEAGDHMHGRDGKFREIGDLSVPCGGEDLLVRFLPVRFLELAQLEADLIHRPDERYARLDRAVV